MFRAEALEVEPAEGLHTLPVELTEISTIAGRATVSGVGPTGLRLIAVTERAPGAKMGDTVHIRLPESPAGWFTTTGARAPIDRKAN